MTCNLCGGRPKVQVSPKRVGTPPEEDQMADVNLALRSAIDELRLFAPSLNDPVLDDIDMVQVLTNIVSKKKLGEMTCMDLEREFEKNNQELQRRRVKRKLSRRSGVLGNVPEVPNLLTADERMKQRREQIERQARKTFRSFLKNPFYKGRPGPPNL